MKLTAIFSSGLIVLLTGCGLQHMGKPAPTMSDIWIKPGFTKNMIWNAVVACGYSDKTWSIAQQELTDKCLLSQGFVFVDSPYGNQGARCKHIEYQHLPSCQSLKNPKK